MLFIDNEGVTDPRLNLAIEEHLLRNVQVEDALLLFYINEPAVIVGRNQNILEEIDPDYIKAKNIHVLRRLSGGGAVYHDLGNLNFSIITPGKEDLHNFAKFTDPVIKTLRELGLDAELRGKSDIFAAGKKISGNAQYAAAGRMFSHGTLLFDSDLEALSKALNPRQVQIESKAVQSVRNLVTNIRELLAEDMTIEALKQAILLGIFGAGQIPTNSLSPADWNKIRQISADRYRQWDWNYGRSPKFHVQNSHRFPIGTIDLGIDVKGGRIQAVKIDGDFAGRRRVIELEEKLVGLRYDREALAEALGAIDLGLYFGPLDQSAFFDLLAV